MSSNLHSFFPCAFTHAEAVAKLPLNWEATSASVTTFGADDDRAYTKLYEADLHREVSD